MSMFRFAGTVKEIVHKADKTCTLKFVPDQENAVCKDEGGKKVKHAVFLPFDKTGEGFAFAYEDKVEIAVIKKVKWLPAWKGGGHYAFVLESAATEKDVDIEVKDAPESKYFRVESVAEKA